MILAPSANYQQHLTVCPSHIKFNHFDELDKGSAIDPAIVAANFESVQGDALLEWLTEHKLAQLGGHAQQYATGPVRGLLRRVQPVTDGGGWQFQGLDPFNNWGPMDWGCFKPDHPRQSWKKTLAGTWFLSDDLIKYEHPQGTGTRAFFCDLDPTNPTVGRNFWEQAKADKNIPIILNEGAKKSACLMSHRFGFAAIGLPGVAMWNKPKTRELIAELQLFAVKGRVFYICFDQDTKRKTRRAVGREISKLSSALKRYGCKVKVIQWSQELGKGVDDLIAAHGVEPFQQAYEQAISAEVFTVQRMSDLGFTPDWVAPAGMKFLTDAGLVEAIPTDVKLVGVKAPKGTGKTELAKQLADKAHARGQRVLLLCHRIQLVETLGQRVGVRCIYEFKDEKGEVQAEFKAEIKANGLSICTHSCHPNSQNQLNGDEWTDALIIPDEATQSFWDLLNNSTLTNNRVPVLKEIRALLAGVLSPESEGQLVLLDADLDYITIDGIRGIAGQPDLKPWIAVSHYKEESCNYHVHKSGHQCLMNAEADIRAGKKLLISTDSQKEKGDFSSTALANRLGNKFPDKQILVLDSKTLKTKGHPAFGAIKNLDALLLLYDIVICSPSVETGVSIKDKEGHFDKVYGFFQGVQSVNSVRQSLARLRTPVDREIYVATRGLEFIGGGDTYWQSLIDNITQKASAILGELVKASIDDHGGSFLDSALEMWAKYAARHNAGMAAYRETVIALLRAEGQTVTEEGSPDQDAKDGVKESKAEAEIGKHDRLVNSATAICSAEDISDNEYEKEKENLKPKTKARQLEIARKKLSKEYGAEPTIPLCILEQSGWHSQIKLDYLMTVGRKNLKGLEKEKLNILIKASAGDGLWLPDIARVSLALKVAALDWLKVPQLRDMAGTDQAIHKDHPLVIKILETALSNPEAVRLALGVTVNKKSRPITFIKALLKKIGFTAQEDGGSTGPRDARVRTHRVVQVDSKPFELGSEDKPNNIEYSYSREPIFEHWLVRDGLKLAEIEAREAQETKTQAEQEVKPVCAEKNVCISGNSSSSTPPNAYPHSPIERQAGTAQNPPSKLTQVERVCLDILQTCDHWGQFLNVQARIGAQKLDQLLGMLTEKQLRFIRDMEPQGGTS